MDDQQNQNKNPFDQSSTPIVPSAPLDITPPMTPPAPTPMPESEPEVHPTTTFTTTVTTPQPEADRPMADAPEPMPPMPEPIPAPEPLPAAPQTTTFTTTVSTPTPQPTASQSGGQAEPFPMPSPTTTEPPKPEADQQMPTVKPKNKISPIIGGIVALFLVVGVAGAAYYVSNQLSTQKGIAPNAPASLPKAAEKIDTTKNCGTGSTVSCLGQAAGTVCIASGGVSGNCYASSGGACECVAPTVTVAQGIGGTSGDIGGAPALPGCDPLAECTPNSLTGAGVSHCISTDLSATMYCCPVGQTAVNGACVAPVTGGNGGTGTWYCGDSHTGAAPTNGTICSNGVGTYNGRCVVYRCPQGCTNSKCGESDPGVIMSFTDCASATIPAGECGQIDTVTDSGTYCSPETGCDVKNIVCSCAGTSNPTGTVTQAAGGACMLINIYKKVGTEYSTTPMTTAELQALRVGDVLKFSLTSNTDNLSGRFMVTIGSAAGAWLTGTVDATDKKLITYSDYTVATAGTYKFEAQVSTTP